MEGGVTPVATLTDVRTCARRTDGATIVVAALDRKPRRDIFDSFSSLSFGQLE